MFITLLLIAAVAFLAYSNGANDNFKGVASLYGSRTTSYRTALTWATITTAAGSLCSIFLASALLSKFKGKGLVPDELVGSEYFLLSVALGAGCTVILATRFGFPISTTHGLTGAMVGSGLVAAGSQVQLGVLGTAFMLPLLLSPLMACVLGGLLYAVFHWARLGLRISKQTCVCVGNELHVIQPATDGMTSTPAAGSLTVTVAEQGVCIERYAGTFSGVNCQQLMDTAHFISAGVVSFARGLNDTPKIAALLAIVSFLGGHTSMIVVAVAMAIGGLIHSARIAETMSHKITAMNHGQGFSANLATGMLVICASLFGLPVSTTHVSVGALFGIGVTTGQADYKVVSGILLSWVLTLPCAALIGGSSYWLLTTFA
ncbi:Low-affinity inorganic phosphate transporter 1 [Anatilimnocola aggregata]|uniref:Phosphate transporter n=1 Tax=Anatilimnocola aggregata TaxID=2528021 RepID=A0A517YMQ5_9BACT|nr:inorganic phosphate transporter [Anatilimnocola aggregata]QDU31491.1 Low-affinity inorganic phosphate transporter 1 [Anatilimnocola aggregata]